MTVLLEGAREPSRVGEQAAQDVLPNPGKEPA